MEAKLEKKTTITLTLSEEEAWALFSAVSRWEPVDGTPNVEHKRSLFCTLDDLTDQLDYPEC